MLTETEKPPNKQISAMGELIRKARQDAGLTQAQLAKKIHLKRLAVSEIENFDPMKMIKDRRDTIYAFLEREEELDALDEQGRKNK